MPAEVSGSPPIMHEPSHSNVRPRGILKNPSFSGQGGQGPQSPTREASQPTPPPSAPLDPQEEKDLTLQNTIQNAGHRRSSSAARRSSASRRHSSAAGMSQGSQEDDNEKMRLKWDEANLYLAEQDRGGRMKITEPKTPFEYGMGNAMEEDEEDVGIDPRFVNVDEVEMAKKPGKKARESDIPGLELGEPEYEPEGVENGDERIIRQGSLSRDASKEKHVDLGDQEDDIPDMPSYGEQEKHKVFEEQRKKHYEMRNVKDMLGNPDSLDDDDDDDTDMSQAPPTSRVNGRP